MKKRKTNEKGFTLIEIIVTLILVGITAAMAGMWIVSVAKGNIFARTNAGITQKAQLAMTRLVKEFTVIQSVDADTTKTDGTKITYTRTDSALSSVAGQKVEKSGSDLKLNTNTLTDNVSSIELKYCNIPTTGAQTCGTSWSSTSRIIEIKLILTAGNNTPVAFTRRVTPRNL